MKMAEKFRIPVVTLLDTPGAYPGLEAEERGQGEAIARNIYEMTRLKTPIITVVIGEGASGGALGIGVGNKVYMMENTWYTVISPESCSSILWRSWEYKEQAAEALKLTGTDMKKLKLIDGIIQEPIGGAHSDREGAFEAVKNQILSAFDELKDLSISWAAPNGTTERALIADVARRYGLSFMASESEYIYYVDWDVEGVCEKSQTEVVDEALLIDKNNPGLDVSARRPVYTSRDKLQESRYVC